ncbi:hypothetical protein V1511DRAFT_74717 [Dipodascopsis uninucleata]
MSSASNSELSVWGRLSSLFWTGEQYPSKLMNSITNGDKQYMQTSTPRLGLLTAVTSMKSAVFNTLLSPFSFFSSLFRNLSLRKQVQRSPSVTSLPISEDSLPSAGSSLFPQIILDVRLTASPHSGNIEGSSEKRSRTTATPCATDASTMLLQVHNAGEELVGFDLGDPGMIQHGGPGSYMVQLQPQMSPIASVGHVPHVPSQMPSQTHSTISHYMPQYDSTFAQIVAPEPPLPNAPATEQEEFLDKLDELEVYIAEMRNKLMPSASKQMIGSDEQSLSSSPVGSSSGSRVVRRRNDRAYSVSAPYPPRTSVSSTQMLQVPGNDNTNTLDMIDISGSVTPSLRSMSTVSQFSDRSPSYSPPELITSDESSSNVSVACGTRYGMSVSDVSPQYFPLGSNVPDSYYGDPRLIDNPDLNKDFMKVYSQMQLNGQYPLADPQQQFFYMNSINSGVHASFPPPPPSQSDQATSAGSTPSSDPVSPRSSNSTSPASSNSSPSSSPGKAHAQMINGHVSPTSNPPTGGQAMGQPILNFQCPHCPSRFRIKGYLTRHLKKHAINKAYTCPFYDPNSPTPCHSSGGFSRRDTYKTHLKSRHFVYPAGTRSDQRAGKRGWCAACGMQFACNENWVENHVEGGECRAFHSIMMYG